MDLEVRIKALARLAQSTTGAAAAALELEMAWVEGSLNSESDYDKLAESLAVLHAIAFRFIERSIIALESFIRTIEDRKLSYADSARSVFRQIEKYNNAESLIGRSVSILESLRYADTPAVLRILIGLSNHQSEGLRKKALSALERVGTYDIDVFYGTAAQPGIGARPQLQIISELERFDGSSLRTNFLAVVTLVNALLSTTMEGTAWSSSSVMISRAQTPPLDGVSDVRHRSIALLKRLYSGMGETRQKLQIISALTAATRTDGGMRSSDELAAMIVRDAKEVLAFFTGLVATEELAIVEKIEHNSYWTFFHASQSETKRAALQVKAALDGHREYQFYRILVGFEGVFGDWSEVSRSGHDHEASARSRKEAAAKLASEITDLNFSEWHERIVNYLKTESDDLATFQVFYQFVEGLATKQPGLALKLIAEDSDKIAPVLIPVLRALWAGDQRDAVRAVIKEWITQGRHLYASTKQFLSNPAFDIDLLKRALDKALELSDLRAVSEVIAVAVSNYSPENEVLVDTLFVPAIEAMTARSNAHWILDVWFLREARDLFNALNERQVDLVLRNLRLLPKIDYHAEEVLFLIANKAPESVVAFFVERTGAEAQGGEARAGGYESIPFEFHKLHEPLSRIPAQAVRLVLAHFESDRSLFQFRGARLLKNIFPRFSAEFEAELLKLVEEGGNAHHRFVLGILRNYHGEPFIHRVCKAIIKAIPIDSPLRDEVAIALETTGVVSGEYGLAEAYQRKQSEVGDWASDESESVREFAKWYTSTLEQMQERERKRAAEEIALRAFRYGEESGEAP